MADGGGSPPSGGGTSSMASHKNMAHLGLLGVGGPLIWPTPLSRPLGPRSSVRATSQYWRPPLGGRPPVSGSHHYVGPGGLLLVVHLIGVDLTNMVGPPYRYGPRIWWAHHQEVVPDAVICELPPLVANELVNDLMDEKP